MAGGREEIVLGEVPIEDDEDKALLVHEDILDIKEAAIPLKKTFILDYVINIISNMDSSQIVITGIVLLFVFTTFNVRLLVTFVVGTLSGLVVMSPNHGSSRIFDRLLNQKSNSNDSPNSSSALVDAILEISQKLAESSNEIGATNQFENFYIEEMDPEFELAADDFLSHLNRDFIDKWYLNVCKSKSRDFQDMLKHVLTTGIKGIVDIVSHKKQNELISLITFGLASALIIHTKEYRQYESSGLNLKQYLQTERGKSLLSIPVYSEIAEMKHLKNLSFMILEKILPRKEMNSRLAKILGTEFFAGFVLHATIGMLADPDWINLKIVEMLGKKDKVDQRYLGMIKLKGSQMRTRMIEGDSDFIWNEEFRYNIKNTHSDEEVFLLQVEVLQSGFLMVKEKLVGIINIPFSINKLRTSPRIQKWFKFDQLPSVNSPSDAEILLDINFLTNQVANTETASEKSENKNDAVLRNTNPLSENPIPKTAPILTLSIMVQSPDILVSLMDYLESLDSLKYIKFWMAAQSFQKFGSLSDTKMMLEDALELLDIYLNVDNPWCCLDAFQKGSVDQLVERVKKNGNERVSPDIFLQLQQDIEAYLEEKLLKEFRDSASFKKLIGVDGNVDGEAGLVSYSNSVADKPESLRPFSEITESPSIVTGSGEYNIDSINARKMSNDIPSSEFALIMNLRKRIRWIDTQVSEFNNETSGANSDVRSIDLAGLAKEREEVGRELIYQELLYSKSDKMTVRVKPLLETQDSPFILEMWTLKDPTFLWSITRRYSEFSRLHVQLKKRYPKASKLPFPTKPPLERLQTYNVTRQMDLCRELEKYLNMLVSDVVLGQSQIFRYFLLATMGSNLGAGSSEKDMSELQESSGSRRKSYDGNGAKSSKGVMNVIGQAANRITGFFDRMETAAIKVSELSRERGKSIPMPVEPNADNTSTLDIGSRENLQGKASSSRRSSNGGGGGSVTSLAPSSSDQPRFKEADLDLLFESVFAILENIFELNESEQWLRRKVLNIVKQFLRQNYSHLVEELLNKYINQRPPEETATIVVRFMREQLWPQGQPWGYNTDPEYVKRTGEIPFNLRTEEQRLVTKIEARSLLTSQMPEALTRVLGGRNTTAGMTRLFNMLQHRTLNKHLLHVSFELVIKLFFGDKSNYKPQPQPQPQPQQ